MRIRDEYLEYLDIAVPASNAPHYSYGKGSNCDHVVELAIREERLWCPICRLEDAPLSQLRRIYLAPAMAQVWWEHENLATGQVESDPKKFRTHLADAAKRHEDQLGFPADYQPTDPTELRREWANRGKDVEAGLDATHDHRVRTGQKPSRGKFVY